MTNYTDIKLIMLNFFISICAFFAPLGVLALAVGIAITLDTVTGLIKAYKTKQDITSRKFSQIIIKMFVYQSSLLTLFVVDHFLLDELVKNFTEIHYASTKIGALVLVLTEFKSINENFKAVFNVDIIQFVKNLIKGIREDIGLAKDIKELKQD